MATNIDYSNVSPDEAILRLNEIIFSGDPEGGISNAKLEEIQNLLNIAGFDSGTPDGFEGPNTANGLARFVNQQGQPSYNDANPEGRLNSTIDRIIETYGSPENVRDYQQMFGPIRTTDEVLQETNSADLQTIEQMLNAPINETNTIALQTALEAVGLAPGTIDGDWGEKTAGATLNHLRDNYDLLLTMDSDNLEFILGHAKTEDLAHFQDSLRRDPAFYDLLKSKLDGVEGDLADASREQLTEIQQLMTAAGYYDRGIDGIHGAGTQAGADEFNATERPPETTPLTINITPEEPEQIQADVVEETVVAETVPEPDSVADDTGPEVQPDETLAVQTVSHEVMQDIYDRLAALDPKLVDIASVNTKFTYSNIERCIETEAAYEAGMANDETTMIELSELENARTTARMTYEFAFQEGVFTEEDAQAMLLEIDRMEQGLHPSTGRPIQEVEHNGQTYLISSAAEEGYTFDFNALSQVIPEAGSDPELQVASAEPIVTSNYTV
ncbi:MAG: hypothetical protein JKY71_03880 [Alphaproteobacteria bacterium]|nr:hypothetical protein [Alphaproteobacteria bacterium]